MHVTCTGGASPDLSAGEADASSWHLQVEARLGVLLPAQSWVICTLLAIQPVNAHVTNSKQNTAQQGAAGGEGVGERDGKGDERKGGGEGGEGSEMEREMR